MKNIKKIAVNAILVASLLLPFVGASPVFAVSVPNWNVSGSYVMDQHYLGSDNPHNVTLVQDSAGNLTGNGNSGAYTWVIDSGSVSADTVEFTAHYTATDDAVNPLTVLKVTSTVASNGTMSGTWSDNYQGGDRSGEWTTDSGSAIPMSVITHPATNITLSDATLNGVNGGINATQSSFWVSTHTFSTDSTTLPDGVYSTADLGPVSASTNFSSLLSSVSGLPAVTANTTYYVVAWSNMNGVWMHGNMINFTTSLTGSSAGGSVDGDVVENGGVLHVDSISALQSSAIADGTFANGLKYVFHLTTPKNEKKLAFKFSDWLSGTNSILVANNMRISSAQADNSGATILLAGANIYSSPTLNITSDLDADTSGNQVDVVVELSVPVGSAIGSYSSSYGISTTP